MKIEKKYPVCEECGAMGGASCCGVNYCPDCYIQHYSEEEEYHDSFEVEVVEAPLNPGVKNLVVTY